MVPTNPDNRGSIVVRVLMNPYIGQICKQGPNIAKERHRILVKDLKSSNFLNANNKKGKTDQTVEGIHTYYFISL